MSFSTEIKKPRWACISNWRSKTHWTLCYQAIMIAISISHQSLCFQTTHEPKVSACKSSFSKAHPIRLKSSSKLALLQLNEMRYINGLEQLVSGVQQLVDAEGMGFVWRINKAKRSKKMTDWNRAKNHGNSLLLKEFTGRALEESERCTNQCTPTPPPSKTSTNFSGTDVSDPGLCCWANRNCVPPPPKKKIKKTYLHKFNWMHFKLFRNSFRTKSSLLYVETHEEDSSSSSPALN